MEEQFLFAQFSFWRRRAIKRYKAMPEEVVKTVPDGFNNNVLWNLGHIAFVWDSLFKDFGEEGTCPESYNNFFDSGTSPKEWLADVPSLESLIEVLENQEVKIIEMLTGKLNQPHPKPIFGFGKVGEMVLFALSHECIHFGNIKSIARVTSAIKLDQWQDINLLI